VRQREDDVDDGEDARDHGDPDLQFHDQVEANDASPDDEGRHHDEGNDLRGDPPIPAEFGEYGGCREHGQRGERCFPAHRENPGQHCGHAIAPHPKGRSAQHHRRRGAALPCKSDDAAEQE